MCRIKGAFKVPAGEWLMPRHWNILWLAGQFWRSVEMQREGTGIIGWEDEGRVGMGVKTGLTTISACQVSALARISRPLRNDKGLPLRVGFFSRVLRGLLIVKQA